MRKDGQERRGEEQSTRRENISESKTWREPEVAGNDRVTWRRRNDGSILHEERMER